MLPRTPARAAAATLAALLGLPLAACTVHPYGYPYSYPGHGYGYGGYGYGAPPVGSNTAAGAAAGAVAGGLLGAAVAGRHDRGTGALGGAAAGALIGGLLGNAADRENLEAATAPPAGYYGYGYAPGYAYGPPPPGYGYVPGYGY